MNVAKKTDSSQQNEIQLLQNRLVDSETKPPDGTQHLWFRGHIKG